MKVTVNLTRREAEAVAKGYLTVWGDGVQRSKAVESATFKLREAAFAALRDKETE